MSTSFEVEIWVKYVKVNKINLKFKLKVTQIQKHNKNIPKYTTYF